MGDLVKGGMETAWRMSAWEARVWGGHSYMTLCVVGTVVVVQCAMCGTACTHNTLEWHAGEAVALASNWLVNVGNGYLYILVCTGHWVSSVPATTYLSIRVRFHCTEQSLGNSPCSSRLCNWFWPKKQRLCLVYSRHAMTVPAIFNDENGQPNSAKQNRFIKRHLH